MLLQPSLTSVSYCTTYIACGKRRCRRYWREESVIVTSWHRAHRSGMYVPMWYVWIDLGYDEVNQSALPLFWYGALAMYRPAYSQQKSFVLHACDWLRGSGVINLLVSGLNSTLLHAIEVYYPASIIASEDFETPRSSCGRTTLQFVSGRGTA